MGSEPIKIVTMDEWMKKFLANPETLSTSKQKEEVVKTFVEFKSLENKELYENREQLKDVCRRVADYVSQTKTSIINKDQVLTLEPFYAKVVDFTLSLALVSVDIPVLFRNETCLLETLTSHLSDNYKDLDQARMLKAIEVLTRGISVSWSAPYLTYLIKETFKVLLAPSTSPETSLYGLRIITNLVFQNQICLNIVFRDTSYALVLKRVISLMSDKYSTHELTTMALNFCYLTDKAISMRLSTQINNIRNAFREIQKKVETENFKDVQGLASTIYYITLCVSTALSRCAKEYHEAGTESSQDSSKEKTNVKKVVEEISGIVFSRFFPKLIPLLRTKNGQIVVVSLLKLMKALCPNDLPVEIYENQWGTFAKSLSELSMVVLPKSVAQFPVLETHLHFVDRILLSKSSISAESFKYALNKCEIVVSLNYIDLSKNILTIRLLNRLNVLDNSQSRMDGGDSVTSKISALLNEESLWKLLTELLSEKTDEHVFRLSCIEMSTCVIEIASIFTKMAKSTKRLMEILENEKTWFHIANCIENGNNEETIGLAVTLLGAVGFSTKCHAGVTRNLLKMKATTWSSSNSGVILPERGVNHALATVGKNKLNVNLEMFNQNYEQGNDVTMDYILSWYKLKTDMIELELSNMQEHASQLDQTIKQQKALLNKQSELVAKCAISSANQKKDYIDLKKQLQITEEKKQELCGKHAKSVESFRQQLFYQEGVYKGKCNRLLTVETELKDLKNTSAELKTTRDEAVDGMQRATTEKRKLQEKLEEVEKSYKTTRQRLSTVENDLKKSEEARKTAEAQLEAERRKTEIIQQVLGNRLN